MRFLKKIFYQNKNIVVSGNSRFISSPKKYSRFIFPKKKLTAKFYFILLNE